MSKQIKVSVRNLVEFVLRSGDIDNTFVGSTRAVEGTRAHQKVQSSYGDDYIFLIDEAHNLVDRLFD